MAGTWTYDGHPFAGDDDAKGYVMWRAEIGCPEARAAIRMIVESWEDDDEGWEDDDL